jgi:hypothetical protein
MNLRKAIQCQRCGQPFETMVETVIDPAVDPEGKMRLVTGRLNQAQCPNCRTVNTVATPLIYHDGSKELLITFVPAELGLQKDRSEKMIGDMMREVTSSLPPGGMKGYFFQPRQALTLQGLIDQVLAADGVTPDMVEAQRNKMRLAETFVGASDEELVELVAQNDGLIDAEFMQLMSLMAQRVMSENRPDIAQAIVMTQQRVLDLSSFGQQLLQQQQLQEEAVNAVAMDIQALGAGAQRSDFMTLAEGYLDDDQRLQALVGLVRPAFDQQFFQELAVKTSAAPTADRERLETLRDRLTELVAMMDQQSQYALQAAAEVLQSILQAPNPAEIIRENLNLIDDTFMAVLSANIQESERQQNIAASARLKEIYNHVMAALRDNMQPELRFINDLLATEDPTSASAMITQAAQTFGPRLLEMFDAVGEMIASRGGNPAVMQRLAALRDETAQALN